MNEAEMGATHSYLIALGSNRRHHLYGRPRDVIDMALIELLRAGISIRKVSPIVLTAPVGPSLRRYANAAALIESSLEPDELLELLKNIERAFGRRAGGQRWTARVLDLDIILWSGGTYADPALTIPHPLFRDRTFVLEPAGMIAPRWRDPITGLTLQQLTARLTAPRSLPR